MPTRIRQFGEALGISPTDVLPLLPEGYQIDDAISMGTIENLCYRLNVIPERQSHDMVAEPQPFRGRDDPAMKRPAVVTIMGHVDHGKTTLLDRLRNSNVAEREFGGITQHIGAFEVTLPSSPDDRITFIDTPGHEAFVSMRSAGAQVTDMVVLVVAADDGVGPQTLEAIEHARAAKLPIIVAINKVDKHNANVARTELQLMQQGLVPEDRGGDTPFVHLSALNGTNLDKLQEEIVLLAEGLQLCAKQQDCPAEATVIEARVDLGVGICATVIVKRGTLAVGKWMLAGSTYGRIRLLRNYLRNSIDVGLPSMPVELMGLEEIPRVGDTLIEVSGALEAKRIVDSRKLRHAVLLEDEALVKEEAEKRKNLELKSKMKKEKPFDHFFTNTTSAQQTISQSEKELNEQLSKESSELEAKQKVLPVIIKVDVQGTLDAFNEIVAQYPSDEVKLEIIQSAVGVVNETDIEFASQFGAQLIAMNVKIPTRLQQLAKTKSVQVHSFRVIYHMIDHLKKQLSELLEPLIQEEVLGEARVKQVFQINKLDVAGAEVTKGSISTSADWFKVIRWNKELFNNLKLESLQHFKDRVKEVKKGQECGISLEGYIDMKIDDIIVAMQRKVIPRSFDELLSKHLEQKRKQELKLKKSFTKG